ncbi:aldehyde dehydrogenase [Spirochaeta dissipatitropha]
MTLNPVELRRKQGEFFSSGRTRSPNFRIAMLKQLLNAIKRYENDFLAALAADLGKSEFEAYSNEIGLVYSEIRLMMRRLRRWSMPRFVRPDLHLLPSSAWVQPEPYGSALIIGPWNYPMQLLFMPFVGAIAAGNTAVLKPSELAVATAEVTTRLIEETFPQEYVAVVQGGPEESQALIDQAFDYLFFTGSVPVGRKVMAAAAPHLTPVTLELGGKSPAFVTSEADIETAARRIAWGKFNNAGQTCVAPDYVLVDRKVSSKFLTALEASIREFYGEDARSSENYGRIINERNFLRLQDILNASEILSGGAVNHQERYMEPSILYPADWDSESMKDEIFGPLLPVIEYDDLNEAAAEVRSRPRPLALYVFSNSKKEQRWLTSTLPFGGGAINTTILHVASHRLPFGGIGNSGMGAYHGKASFDTFTHLKAVLRQPLRPDIKLAYPHRHISMKLLRRLLR